MDARTVTAVVFLVLGSLACSAPPAPGPATGGDQRPATQQEPKRGGTLVFGNAKDMTTPHPYNQNFSVSAFINDSMYEPLVMYDVEGKLHGMLAEKWEASPDAKEWTFTLRKGVKFHDGREMTAADVVFSANYVLEPGNAAYGQTALAGDVAAVAAVDRSTVKFTMKGSRGLFPHAISDISTLHVIPANSLNPGPKLEGPRPPGTGPFKFEEWVPQDRTVVSRFDGYWGGAAYLDGIVFKQIANEQARGNALRAGDIHIGERMPLDLVTRVQKGELPGFQLQPATTGRALVYNTTSPLLKDKRMREAVSLSIDRDAVLEEVYFGLATAVDVLVPKGSDWEKALNVTPRKRDVARARQLARDAGYDGSPLVLMATRGQDVGVGEAVARMAKEAGINITVKSLEFTVWSEAAQKGDFDIAVQSQEGQLEPGVDLRDEWKCEKGELRKGNRSGFCNQQADGLFDRYVVEPDRSKRVQIFSQIAKIVHDEFIDYSLGWTNARFFAWRDSLKGFTTGGQQYFHATGGLKKAWLDQ